MKQTRGNTIDYKKFYEAETQAKQQRKSVRRVADNTLYPISIVPSTSTSSSTRESTRVRVHYIGYGARCDEWRDKSELVQLTSPCVEDDYDLYSHLALSIKSLLVGKRKSNPVSRVEMAFDKKAYDDGLGAVGFRSRSMRGKQYYTINLYSDLNHLLGSNWHYRGLNSTGDFCYVILETVEYYLYQRRPLVHYIVGGDGQPVRCSTPRGHALVFSFVRGDGTPTEFGKNDIIFK